MMIPAHTTPTMKTVIPWLLLTMLFGSGNVESRADNGSTELHESFLDKVLSGLERVLEFFESGYFEVNMDGLYGVRMCQVALCGILGFEDFFMPKWMRVVLNMQTDRGCFTLPSSIIEYEDALEKIINEIFKLQKQLSKESDTMDQATKDAIIQRLAVLENSHLNILVIARKETFAFDLKRGSWPKRRLMSEKVMGGDCLAHKTGLGAATFGVYLIYLVRQLFEGI